MNRDLQNLQYGCRDFYEMSSHLALILGFELCSIFAATQMFL